MKRSGQDRRQNRRRASEDDAPLTAAELRTARPARLAVPHIVEAAIVEGTRRRAHPRHGGKPLVTRRLDKDAISALRASGQGWPTRIKR